MEYGYIRVSSKEQNVDRQIDALHSMGLDTKQIYIDKQSGKNFDRPAYKKLMKRLRAGDLKSIDRLGRNYDEILDQWRVITKMKRADIYVMDFPLLDTRKKDNDLTGTFIADLVLQILSYVAQTEREFIHQRQAEGIEAAKKRGVRFGRKRIELSECFEEMKQRHLNGELTIRSAAALCHMNPSTFYNYCQDIKCLFESKILNFYVCLIRRLGLYNGIFAVVFFDDLPDDRRAVAVSVRLLDRRI